MSARISPAEPPFDAPIQAALDKIMQGRPPLVLFTTMARDPRLFSRFFGASLLDRGNLTLRQREIVIDRTTALCKSEYEWGVHVATYGTHVGLDSAQIRSLVYGGPSDPCWAEEERILLRLCDALHADCTIDDDLWQSLTNSFSDEAILEILMLAGFYHTVSYLTNVLRLPLEADAVRFPPAQP
jgi:alkylhydroperoxidase family enzyme